MRRVYVWADRPLFNSPPSRGRKQKREFISVKGEKSGIRIVPVKVGKDFGV
jgi:hypothetical protein